MSSYYTIVINENCTCSCCCGDGERGRDHLTRFGFKDAYYNLCSYYGYVRFLGCEACCPLKPSTSYSCLIIYFIYWTSSCDRGLCASS